MKLGENYEQLVMMVLDLEHRRDFRNNLKRHFTWKAESESDIYQVNEILDKGEFICTDQYPEGCIEIQSGLYGKYIYNEDQLMLQIDDAERRLVLCKKYLEKDFRELISYIRTQITTIESNFTPQENN